MSSILLCDRMEADENSNVMVHNECEVEQREMEVIGQEGLLSDELEQSLLSAEIEQQEQPLTETEKQVLRVTNYHPILHKTTFHNHPITVNYFKFQLFSNPFFSVLPPHSNGQPSPKHNSTEMK